MPKKSTGKISKKTPVKTKKPATKKKTIKTTVKKTRASKKITPKQALTQSDAMGYERRNKPVLKTEAPIIKVVQENHDAKMENREKRIEIKSNTPPPISPYVIDFKNKELVASTPAPSSLADSIEQPSYDVPQTHEPDFAALESFLNEKPKIEKQEVPKVAPVVIKEQKPNRLLARMRAFCTQLAQPRTPLNHQEKTKAEPTPSLAPQFVAPSKSESKKIRITNHRLRITPLIRATASFAILAIIFTVPAAGLSAFTKLEQTKTALTLQSKTAIEGLATMGTEPNEIIAALGQATAQFTQAKTELENAVGIFKTIVPLIPKAGGIYKNGTLLFDAGAHLTEAGRIITDGFTTLTTTEAPFGTRLVHLEEALRAAFPLIRAAELELNRVSLRAVPEEVQTILPTLTHVVNGIRASFAETIALLPALGDFLGVNQTKRYLLVFQNQNELRPTGGFIGSFALLDVDRGEITNLEIPGGGPYDLACCLLEHVIAPEPLQLIEPHWQFHDANWFPDFPTSAKKLMWFYEKSGGPSVDGVIAFNASLIPALLNVLGPVELQDFNRVFTSTNVIQELQKIVELEYDKEENKPKAVIGELAPVLLERIMTASPDKLLSLLSVFGDALNTKEIQIYSADPDTQLTFSKAGWTGEMKQTDGDYLMVVSSNIAGGKTNAVIETEIHHRAVIQNDGSIIDRVDIIKTHHGQKGELFTGIRNVDYLRIYVPEGSRLLEARGFLAPDPELFDAPDANYKKDADLAALVTDTHIDPVSGTTIQTEQEKTVFGNWIQIDPGETRVASFTYQLPFTLAQNINPHTLRKLLGIPTRIPYTLMVQPQSGAHAQWQSEITVPQTLTPFWKSENLATTEQGFQIAESLDRDVFAALLFEKGLSPNALLE